MEKKLNDPFEATPRSEIDHYMGMHVVYDKQKGHLTLDARRHVYGFIDHMCLDPRSDVGVSTPLDPHEIYSNTRSTQKRILSPKLTSNAWTKYGKLAVN